MNAHSRPEKPAADTRLLTTREAAAFLKVSEASIRRWTDSGLLPTSRVGRRRARRLREEDLRTFLETDRSRQPPGLLAGLWQAHNLAASETRPTPTMVIQDVVVPLGSHLASFYTTEEGRLRNGLPFLRDGLLGGQTVLFRGNPDVREYHFDALRKEGVDVDDALRAGRLALFPEGPGSAGDQVVKFDQLLTAAARRRPGPIRLLAEVLVNIETLGSVAEHFVVEQQCGPLFKRFPVVVICAYDVRALDGVAVVQALKLHSDIFGREIGYWLS
jgi:excisionase family DNA binding protein